MKNFLKFETAAGCYIIFHLVYERLKGLTPLVPGTWRALNLYFVFLLFLMYYIRRKGQEVAG
jgi:hypothetical protein